MAREQALVAFVVTTIIVLVTVTPLAVLKLKPDYNPPNYIRTICQVTFSFQNSYRCCEYDTCQCTSYCTSLVSCDALSGQPQNHLSCCHSTTCCAYYVWDTCYRQDCTTDSKGTTTCEEVAYQCNMHCSYWNPVEQCLGTCGICMDSTITIYSQEWNQSSSVKTHCNLDDFSCENQQSNYTVNSTWPCYYQPETHQLVLQTPGPDKLLGFWLFLVIFVSVLWVLALVWTAFEFRTCWIWMCVWPYSSSSQVEPWIDSSSDQPQATAPPAYNPNCDSNAVPL